MNPQHSHIAAAPIVRERMACHLKLSFSDDHWCELLALIDAKVRMDLAAKPISRRQLMAESKAIKSAAQQLLRRLDSERDNAIGWPAFLGGYSMARDIEERRDVTSPTEWRSDARRLLTHFVEAVDMLDFQKDGRRAKGGQNADNHRRQFAMCLSDYFIRAGGTFHKGGRAGFPEFLKLVWELLPDDCRPDTAASFADMIGRPIDRDERRQTSPARADYCIRLTKGYWGTP